MTLTLTCDIAALTGNDYQVAITDSSGKTFISHVAAGNEVAALRIALENYERQYNVG